MVDRISNKPFQEPIKSNPVTFDPFGFSKIHFIGGGTLPGTDKTIPEGKFSMTQSIVNQLTTMILTQVADEMKRQRAHEKEIRKAYKDSF
jgi:hypothetical protein